MGKYCEYGIPKITYLTPWALINILNSEKGVNLEFYVNYNVIYKWALILT